MQKYLTPRPLFPPAPRPSPVINDRPLLFGKKMKTVKSKRTQHSLRSKGQPIKNTKNTALKNMKTITEHFLITILIITNLLIF
jgi:hypothetical protein